MKGRKPAEYKLSTKDRRYLLEIATDGQLIQRFANRARVLLALDRGERICDISRWLGMGRTAVWDLWQRYLQKGVEAIFDQQRSGRPVTFPPYRESANRARGLHRPTSLWVAPDPLGLSDSPASRHRAGNS